MYQKAVWKSSKNIKKKKKTILQMEKSTKVTQKEQKKCMMVCKRKGSSSEFTWLLADIHTLLQKTLHTVLTFSDV